MSDNSGSQHKGTHRKGVCRYGHVHPLSDVGKVCNKTMHAGKDPNEVVYIEEEEISDRYEDGSIYPKAGKRL